MRRFNTIIESANPPGINQLWIDKKKLRYFTEGKWHLLGGGGGSAEPPEISDHDTWIIDGVDTGKPSRGEAGVAPLLRVTDTAVEYSYDGITWTELLPKSEFNIHNNPDEEDITAVDDKLKLKDKPYLPAIFSGLGRVYLRKNIVNDKNVLTQDMINKPNTIYHIQYDYDLNGANITIPDGCTLQFEGGSIGNGTITGTSTYVCGKILILTTLAGTFKDIKVDDVISDYSDISTDINRLTDFCRSAGVAIIFNNSSYITKHTLDFSKISVIGNGATIVGDIDDESPVIASYEFKQGLFMNDITIDCNNKNNIGFLSSDSNDLRVTNIAIINFKYIGFMMTGGASLILTNFYFRASKDCYDYCRGFYTTKPDVRLSNGMIEYTPIAIDTIGGNYSGIHIWGIPTAHNVNIGVLQRHTNVQLTNMEFDSVVSKNSEVHNPDFKYSTTGVPAHKEIYHGGAAIVSLMDSVSAFGSKLTSNTTIDWSGYNKPIYLYNISGNYRMVDKGPVISYGYNIDLYKFLDAKTGYRSELDVPVYVTDVTDYKGRGAVPNGTVIPTNNLVNIANNGGWIRASAAKVKFNSYATYMLWDSSKSADWDRDFIRVYMTTGASNCTVEITINNNPNVGVKDRITIVSKGAYYPKMYYYIEDNKLYMYSDYDYNTTIKCSVDVFSVYTEFTHIGADAKKEIPTGLVDVDYINEDGTQYSKVAIM